MDTTDATLRTLYARAIAACDARDAPALAAVVGELTTTVAFDLEDAARELCWLYGVSIQAAENGRFHVARIVFERLLEVFAREGDDAPQFSL